MALHYVSQKRGRVYERKFDHEEAQRLHAEGASVVALARRYGVNDNAVRMVVDPVARERQRQSQLRRKARLHCRECGGPVSAAKSRAGGGAPRCRACWNKEQATSVHEDTLQCVRCREWKPDDDFPRHHKEPMRRGHHSVCRPCSTIIRTEYRNRRKIPCIRCGKPCLPKAEKGKRAGDSGLCLTCYQQSLREGASNVAQLRNFIILERNGTSWIEHSSVEAFNEALAVETFADLAGKEEGRYVAIPKNAWRVRELQPVTRVKAVAVDEV